MKDSKRMYDTQAADKQLIQLQKQINSTDLECPEDIKDLLSLMSDVEKGLREIAYA